MATAAQKTSQATNGVDKSVKDLEAQIATLKSDVADLTGTLKNLGREGSAELNARARRAAAAAKAKGYETANRAGASAASMYGEAEATVRRNPAASVGVAAGVGFLVGLFMSRRH